jgi:hypothetical protein
MLGEILLKDTSIIQLSENLSQLQIVVIFYSRWLKPTGINAESKFLFAFSYNLSYLVFSPCRVKW